MPSLDLDLIRHALEAARNNGFREVEVGVADASFSAKLLPSKPKPKPSAAGESVAEEKIATINSTVVGYFRPGETPLEVGGTVRQGDLVAVIVALGIANDVESKWSGTVTEVLVSPDQAVEFGQPLAKVRVE
ncbi:MAG TPA: biotin/lipoyl-containing protein [Fimbriimonas sp.]|nr:biotin/lipoyl-containing protein [Fimbriimonas sp.]